MKRTIKGLILLTLAVLLLSPVAASRVAAQDGEAVTGFQDVQLWINPEYDDPRLLVMLQGEIVGAEAPVEVSFLVPSAAEMYSAGSKDAQGVYTGGPPQRESSSIPGWDVITYEAKYPTFRVEYYDPIILGRPDKTIDYEFRWLYPIDSLQVRVQEPLASTDFTVTPAGSAAVDSEGFNIFYYTYSDLDGQSPLEFNIAYTKSDTRPSLTIRQEGTGGSSTSWIIAVVVLVVIFGVVAWLLWFRKPKVKTRSARRQESRATGKARAPARQSSGTKKPARGRFCTQCGHPIDGDYRFCPECGNEL